MAILNDFDFIFGIKILLLFKMALLSIKTSLKPAIYSCSGL